MEDERTAQTRALFFEAWMLLSNLHALQQRLPPADMPPAGGLPSEWNEFRSYARCVEKLRTNLAFNLNMIIQDVGIRNEFDIQKLLLPPQFALDPKAWLDKMGGDEPGQR